MAFGKIIVMLAIIVSITVSGKASEDDGERYQGTMNEKLQAFLRDIDIIKKEVKEVWKVLDTMYEDYQTWNKDFYVIGSVHILKEQTDHYWIKYFMGHFDVLTEADLKNIFYIHLLREIKKQRAFDYYNKDKIDDMINRLEQLDPNKIQKPSWWTSLG